MRKILLWLCATPIVLSGMWVVFNAGSVFSLATWVVGGDTGDPYAWMLVVAFAVPFFVCAWLLNRGIIVPVDIDFITRACAWQVCLGLVAGAGPGFIIVWIGGALVIAYQNARMPREPLL